MTSRPNLNHPGKMTTSSFGPRPTARPSACCIALLPSGREVLSEAGVRSCRRGGCAVQRVSGCRIASFRVFRPNRYRLLPLAVPDCDQCRQCSPATVPAPARTLGGGRSRVGHWDHNGNPHASPADIETLDWPAVYQALLELDERERTIVTLRFFGGCSHEEIADVVHATPGAVRTALSRTLSRLREKFNPAVPPTPNSTSLVRLMYV